MGTALRAVTVAIKVMVKGRTGDGSENHIGPWHGLVMDDDWGPVLPM